MPTLARSSPVRTVLGAAALLVVAGTAAAELLGHDALASPAPVIATVLAWYAVG